MNPVPFCDVGRENRALEPALNEAALRVMRSGRVLMGGEVEAFETELAAWHGVKHAVGVASGTDAVEIALRATCSLRRTVTTTAFTAVPTVNAVEAAGMAFRLVDPDPHTRNAAARLHVHLFGLASDASGADVEDCAHAMGATVNGRLAGTMGLCGAHSFFPTKVLGALGDGGAIITDSDHYAEKARRIRHYGAEHNGDIATRGQNSRLSEIQAAFLRVKLPHVSEWIAVRQQIAARYTAELAGRVIVPFVPPGHTHVHHVYVIQHPERDRIAAALKERGIGTMVHYPRAIHQYERWREPEGSYPNAERLAATVLSLPCFPFLTETEQERVIAAVKEVT